MSATTELLVEEILNLEKQVKAAEDAGQDTSPLKTRLNELKTKLEAATTALGDKRLLKG